MEYRSDSSTITNIRKTPQGGIIVPANLTRTGVFTYDYGNGQRVRELRHPDDVFKADSLASLKNAPLVIGHPAEVNPDNYTALMKGHVDGEPKQDGIYVAADILVQDGDTIRKVADTKELTELSCGYRCKVTPEKGEYNGETYDARQTDHVYNHVGIGPKDWGRAGNAVKVRLDGGESAPEWLSAQDTTQGGTLLPFVSTPVTKTDAVTPAAVVETPAVVHTDAAKDNEALKGQVAIQTLRADAAVTELATYKADEAKRVAKLVEDGIKEGIAAHLSRAVLESEVAALPLKDFKADGKSDRDLQVASLALLSPGLKCDGESDEFVRAAYKMARADAAKATAALGSVNAAAPAARTDGAQARDAMTDARDKNRYDSANAWRGDSWLAANPWKPGAV